MDNSLCGICNKNIQPHRMTAHQNAHQLDAANAQLNPRRRILRTVGPVVPVGHRQEAAAAAPEPVLAAPVTMQGEPYAGPMASECKICMDSRRNAAVFPCGHTEFCLPCIAVYVGKPCPICTKKIEKIAHVYI